VIKAASRPSVLSHGARKQATLFFHAFGSQRGSRPSGCLQAYDAESYKKEMKLGGEFECLVPLWWFEDTAFGGMPPLWGNIHREYLTHFHNKDLSSNLRREQAQTVVRHCCRVVLESRRVLQFKVSECCGLQNLAAAVLRVGGSGHSRA